VEQVIPAQIQAVHDGEPGGRAFDLGHRDGSVERDHRIRRDHHELVIQGQDLSPVGDGRGDGVAVHGVDRRLDLVRTGLDPCPAPQAAPDEGLPLGDERGVPAGPVLVGEQHQGAVRAGPRGPA
jgi:hypothetical protein